MTAYDRGTFSQSRTIMLQGDVDDSMVDTLGVHLPALNAIAPGKPVLILLNSYGGCLTDGVAILDMIHASPAPVYVVGAGACYSAAAMVLALAPIGRRGVTAHTSLMFHAIKVDAGGDLVKNIVGASRFLAELDRKLNEELCKQSKFTAKKLQAQMDAGDEIWLTARQAKAKGVVDYIWTPESWAGILADIRKGRK